MKIVIKNPRYLCNEINIDEKYIKYLRDIGMEIEIINDKDIVCFTSDNPEKEVETAMTWIIDVLDKRGRLTDYLNKIWGKLRSAVKNEKSKVTIDIKKFRRS